jgi:hypothetical protein
MPPFKRLPEDRFHPERWLAHVARKRGGAPDPELLLNVSGSTEEELEIAWHKVRHKLPQYTPAYRWRREVYFFLCHVIMHMGPTDRQAPLVLTTPELQKLNGRGISRGGMKRLKR